MTFNIIISYIFPGPEKFIEIAQVVQKNWWVMNQIDSPQKKLPTKSPALLGLSKSMPKTYERRYIPHYKSYLNFRGVFKTLSDM